MVIAFYRILAFVIGLPFTAGVSYETPFSNLQIAKEAASQQLGMDEAYLIMSNINNSNVSIFLGNAIICEGCDLEEMAVVAANSSVILIIKTEYAYDFEVRSLPFKALSQCHLMSYKFAEHGTYLFKVRQSTEDHNEDCSIVSIEESSHYWSPAIVGILVWVLFIVIIQLCYHTYRSRYFKKFMANIFKQKWTEDDSEAIPLANPLASSENLRQTEHNKPVKSKRFQSLDACRGLSIMVMIFVNYGGGGYWFFKHAVWNGLHLADIAFPWFIWLIGFSIVLSQRSLHAKRKRKRSVLFKICRRTAILFLLGLTDNVGRPMLKNLEILDVLQRLTLCYFFTSVIVLFIAGTNNEPHTARSTIGSEIKQHWRTNLSNSVLRFWPQWLCILLITIVWLLITFLLDVPGCPRGYLGPGGKHEHSKYQNCTGGAARYVDHLILTDSHMGLCGTCTNIYNARLSFVSEGILGTLTGILLCYIGVQAGHSYVHSTSVRCVCTHWLISAIICGSLGLLLSNGGNSNGWIPINKNLSSLTFVLFIASLAFIILIIFYLIVDIGQWLSGAPFVWLGMNSIVIYMAHKFLADRFPVQFGVEETHTNLMALNLYGVFFWTLIAGLMYWKKVFIVI